MNTVTLHGNNSISVDSVLEVKTANGRIGDREDLDDDAPPR